MSASPPIKYRISLREQTCQSRYYAEDLGNGVALKMVEIPGGSFSMGSLETELERLDREGPLHEVTLKGFFMGMYPVTQAQWQAVSKLPQSNHPLAPEPSRFKGKDRPVECVSWSDAVEFCDRLKDRFHREYRLPTEAEWEYACRAGTDTPFHFGETITAELANYNGIDEKYGAYGRGPKGIRKGETTDVGSYPANAFGLHDLHGNVWEWCADHWHSSYADKPDELKRDGNQPWLTAQSEAARPLRGGSWLSNPRYCRSAIRLNDHPDTRNDIIGFRVVCSAARTLG